MASQKLKEIKALMLEGRRQVSGQRTLGVEELRAAFADTMAGLPAVEGMRHDSVDAGGVPAEWTYPEGDSDVNGTLLYLHGGGYFEGSPVTHRRLVASLCLAAGIRGLAVDYRLAPEHPFPAAVDDALAAYKWLIGPAGEDASQVIVAGDSAGGGLAAALLVALRDSGSPLPAGAYLVSPWTDLAGTGDSMRTRVDADPMIDPSHLAEVATWYAPEGEWRNPLVSPQYADLAGLPPLLVHVGDAEVLLDDATRLAERARLSGVAVDCEVWPDAFHVFQALAGILPEADEAVAQSGAWMTKRLLAG
jgi:acetyl esterase/lipase